MIYCYLIYLVHLFRFLYNLYDLICLVHLFYFLYNLYNGTEFIQCVFSTYIRYSASNTIVSFPLQSIICVYYSRRTPNSKKPQTAFLLSSYSPGIKSFSFLGYMTSICFSPVNSVLCLSKTESLSFFVYCKKTGNKRKMVVKETAKDKIYPSLM